MNNMKDGKLFLVLDIDGVLLEAQGYRLACMDTINDFLAQMGQPGLSVDREVMTVGRSSLSSFAESDDGHGQIKVVKPNDALKLRRLIGRAAGRSRGLLRDRGRRKNGQRGDRSKRLQDIRKTH